MGNVVFTLPNEEEAQLRSKAKSVGLTTSAYLRQLVRDSFRRSPDAHHTETLAAIRALVPTLAEAFGLTQKVGRDSIDRLSKALLERYESER